MKKTRMAKKFKLNAETLRRLDQGLVHGGDDDDVATIVDNDCWRPTFFCPP